MAKLTSIIAEAMERKPEDTIMALSEYLEYIEETDKRKYEEMTKCFEKIAYSISKEDAESIVKNMRPHGQSWSYEQVKSYVESKGIMDNFINWYLVMNMVYNDYFETAKKYGHHNDVEFYYCLANNFINDPDAKPLKVEKYFK